MNYKTFDTTEAILFKAFNYPYLGARTVNRWNKVSVQFMFDVPNLQTVRDIVSDYNNHVLSIDAKDLIEAQQFIRKEIFTHRNTPTTHPQES